MKNKISTLFFISILCLLIGSSSQIMAQPTNDNCASAIGIGVSSAGNCPAAGVAGTTINATEDASPNFSCDASGNNNSVWYFFNVPASGEVNIHVSSISGDHKAALFVLGCGGAEAWCNLTPDNENVTGLFPNTGYYIAVWSDAGSEGNFQICVQEILFLPVTLESFSGKVRQNQNVLQWTTSSEENTEKFIIERSLNGRDHWEEVGEIVAKGFTNDQQDYQFIDKTAKQKTYYQLRIVDYDQYEDFSDIIYLEQTSIDPTAAIKIYPIPTIQKVTIEITSGEELPSLIRLSNSVGQIIKEEQITLLNGINYYQMDIKTLPTGVYWLILDNGTERSIRQIIKE